MSHIILTGKLFVNDNQCMYEKAADREVQTDTLLKLRDAAGDLWNDWRWQVSHAIRQPDEFAAFFPFFQSSLPVLDSLLMKCPAAATPYYLSLANRGDPGDPVLSQCLPSMAELASLKTGEDDPLNEEAQSPVPGLIHRYPDRVLIMVTNSCFIHCRHCNRKRIWRRAKHTADYSRIGLMIDYLKQRKSVREVIVSGGDPLTLSNERLDRILGELRSIPHLEALRLGTRAPAVLPYRIDNGLAAVLKKHGPVWINTQFNHPREVTLEAKEACMKLLRAGAPVNNQSVLLKGINDSAETITELCHALQRIGVRPYYLFQCEPVRGAEHFRTPLEKGVEIISKMRGFTSGLCVPTFAIDIPRGEGKITLQPDYLLSTEGRKVKFRNYEGKIVDYINPE